MEMTTFDMERPVVMPLAAPVGAVAPGYPLAAPNSIQWTTGFERQIGHHFGREMAGPARHLGRAST